MCLLQKNVTQKQPLGRDIQGKVQEKGAFLPNPPVFTYP